MAQTAYVEGRTGVSNYDTHKKYPNNDPNDLLSLLTYLQTPSSYISSLIYIVETHSSAKNSLKTQSSKPDYSFTLIDQETTGDYKYGVIFYPRVEQS